MIESIYKAIVNELFNAAYSEIQIYLFILKTWKIVSNFKIVRKLTKDVTASKFTAVFDSRLIFQNFLNFIHQICFEILIYYDSTNKAILINIEFTHLLFVSVLHAHVFSMLLIASFSLEFI